MVDLSFNPAPPALIETTKPWTYTVIIANHSPKEITVDGVVETQTMTGQHSPSAKIVSAKITIPVGQQASLVVNHDPNETPAGALTIEVRVYGQIGNAHWWKSKTSSSIPVVVRPSINLSDFPDSVPPGASWQQQFVIRNDASIDLTLNSVSITEGTAAPQALGGMPITVPAHGSHTFEPFDHAGISSDLRFTINAGFTWSGGVVSDLVKHKTVQVRRDLKPKFKAPATLHVNTDWTFDLKLTNKSTEPVTLRNLRHRLTSADFPDTAQVDITLPTNATIAPGDHMDFTNINGIRVPAAANKLKLEIDTEYVRGTRTFHPNALTKEINIS